MDKITMFEAIDPISNEVSQWVTIDRGNGEFTSMLKSTYDTLVTESAPTA